MSETRRGLRAISRNPLRGWSGRPDSNRRRPAWEAGILPLNYGRPADLILLQRHIVGSDQLVAARLPHEPLVRAVEVDLLIERNRGRLLDPQLVDPLILGEALLLVHHRLRLFHHSVEVLVVPVDEDVR